MNTPKKIVSISKMHKYKVLEVSILDSRGELGCAFDKKQAFRGYVYSTFRQATSKEIHPQIYAFDIQIDMNRWGK